MKKIIYIFAILFSFFFFKEVNAETYSYVWAGRYSSPSFNNISFNSSYMSVTEKISQTSVWAEYQFIPENTLNIPANANQVSFSVQANLGSVYFTNNETLTCINLDSEGTCTLWELTTSEHYRFDANTFQVKLRLSNGIVAPCTLNSSDVYSGVFTATCNIPKASTLNSISISTNIPSPPTLVSFGISGAVMFRIENGSQSIIDNQNQNQQQTNERLDETNQNLSETKDFITSDEQPDTDISALGNVEGIFPAGPVDSLLNIPFKFLSILTSSFSGTCVALTGPFVFDTTLTIPCFDEIIYENVPDSLMIFIDTIPSAFLLILYFKHLYKKVDRAVSMQTNSDDEWGVI